MLASHPRSPARRTRVTGALAVLPVALMLAAVALVAPPASRQATGGSRSPVAVPIGEHSALGVRQVDELNAALARAGRAWGEHAGISRADYEAGSHLDQAAD
jgi:hypothetical protein